MSVEHGAEAVDDPAVGAAAAARVAYDAAHERCVALDRGAPGRLTVTGPDAVAYLDAHISAPLRGLAPGEGRRAALLTHGGGVLGVLRCLVDVGGVALDTEAAALPGLVAALARGRIGWDVELRDRTGDSRVVALVGPAAAAALGPEAPIAPHRHVELRIGDVPAQAVGTPWGVDLRCGAEHAGVLRTALAGRGVPSGPAGLWDVLRVEAGRPAWGTELDERTLAADAGLVPDVVRLDEGLYPGLQFALRQDRSGTVHRAVRLLRLPAPVRAGDEVRGADGRRLGVVGTAVVSPRRGPLALGLLRRSAEPGSRVDVGDVPGVVVATPR